MQHIKLLLTLIIFIIGLYLIFYVNSISKKYKFPYLKKIVLYMGLFNVSLLVLIVGMYFKINLHEDFFFNRSQYSQNISSLLFLLFVFLYIYLIINIVSELLDKEIKTRHRLILFSVLFIYFCFELVINIYPEYIKTIKLLHFIYEYVFDNIILIEFIVLIYMLFANRKTQNFNHKKLVNSFSILFLLRYIFMIILLLIILIFTPNSFIQLLFISGFILLINLIPYLWVKIYFLRYMATLHETGNYTALLENIYNTYAISEREKEIIELILTGKTNKEIENILFISINTVKNHIYKIFKKLGINSRHQLIKFLDFKNHS